MARLNLHTRLLECSRVTTCSTDLMLLRMAEHSAVFESSTRICECLKKDAGFAGFLRRQGSLGLVAPYCQMPVLVVTENRARQQQQKDWMVSCTSQDNASCIPISDMAHGEICERVCWHGRAGGAGVTARSPAERRFAEPQLPCPPRSHGFCATRSKTAARMEKSQTGTGRDWVGPPLQPEASRLLGRQSRVDWWTLCRRVDEQRQAENGQANQSLSCSFGDPTAWRNQGSSGHTVT
jgi:hypothetical protein